MNSYETNLKLFVAKEYYLIARIRGLSVIDVYCEIKNYFKKSK
jgi:hypothetical protein